jgi:dihydrofolate reductase
LFAELVNHHRNVIVGRKAYEAVREWKSEYGLGDFKDAIKIVVTSRKDYVLDEGYDIAESPSAALEMLYREGVETALVAGGASTNTAFISADLVDEFIFSIEPTLLGRGIAIVTSPNFQLRLKGNGIKERPDGIVQLSYLRDR